jgi:hypothetical protein
MNCYMAEMRTKRGISLSDLPNYFQVGDVFTWESCKKKGNLEFQAGKYQDAICQFTQAIKELVQDTTSTEKGMYSTLSNMMNICVEFRNSSGVFVAYNKSW